MTICDDTYQTRMEYEYFQKEIGPFGHLYYAFYSYSGGGYYSQNSYESYLGMTATNLDDTHP
jgi:hypothetical protein